MSSYLSQLNNRVSSFLPSLPAPHPQYPSAKKRPAVPPAAPHPDRLRQAQPRASPRPLAEPPRRRPRTWQPQRRPKHAPPPAARCSGESPRPAKEERSQRRAPKTAKIPCVTYEKPSPASSGTCNNLLCCCCCCRVWKGVFSVRLFIYNPLADRMCTLGFWIFLEWYLMGGFSLTLCDREVTLSVHLV